MMIKNINRQNPDPYNPITENSMVCLMQNAFKSANFGNKNQNLQLLTIFFTDTSSRNLVHNGRDSDGKKKPTDGMRLPRFEITHNTSSPI